MKLCPVLHFVKPGGMALEGKALQAGALASCRLLPQRKANAGKHYFSVCCPAKTIARIGDAEHVCS